MAGAVSFPPGKNRIRTAIVAAANQLFSYPKTVKSMSFHLVAWEASVTNAVATDITPVQDSIMTIQNNHFLPQVNTYLQWVYAGSASLSRARIITPKLRQITTPFIRPTNAALLPASNLGVMDMIDSPLILNGLEELQVEVLQGGAGAEVVYVAAGLSKTPKQQAPNGDTYTMRATGTTTVVAKSWTQAAMTWQDTLPAGQYMVVGMEGVSTTGVAARLVFEQQIDRPGCLLSAADGNIESRIFRNGYLGAWGSFTGNRMPNVEFLCNAADTAQEIFLQFIRIA